MRKKKQKAQRVSPASVTPFNWSEMMEIGLGVLGFSSAHFWQLTLPELAAAIRGVSGQSSASSSPLTQGDFSNLMARFPDFAVKEQSKTKNPQKG